MSIKVFNACRDLQIGAADKSVLRALADYATDDGRNIYPSAQTVAFNTCLCRRTVLRCFERLEALGVLLLQGRRGCGRCNTNHYAIDLAKVAELIATGTPHKPGSTPRKKGDTASPFTNGRAAHFTTAEVQNPEAASQIKGDTQSPFDGLKGDSVSIKGDSASPNPSQPVKEEVESCVTSESSAREAETDVAEHTTVTTGIVVPFVKAGGHRLPMLAGWVPPEEWRRWGVAEGHPDIDAGCAAFRAIWLRRQIQGTAGPPKTEREWWAQFSGWILSDIDQGRYHEQHHKIPGAGSDRGASIRAGAAIALAAVERMASR